MAFGTVVTAVVAVLSIFVSAVNAQAAACQGLTWKVPVNLGTIVVPVGTTCSWVWKDNYNHCVDGEKDLPGFLSPVVAGFGTVFNFTFTSPGTFPYDCCVHLQGMAGVIKVVPVAQAPTPAPAPAPTCIPACHGRCYGRNGCGGTCAKYPKHTKKACHKCCSKGNKHPASVKKCFRACRKKKFFLF